MKKIAPVIAQLYLIGLYITLPIMPILATIFFLRSKFVADYANTLKKVLVHIAALKEGPAHHYFQDVMGRVSRPPATIQGACVQCGNCCMDRRCMFLEQLDDSKYVCGIYHSPFRRLSNCGSFPLDQRDIDRYACPSYTVSAAIPIQLYGPLSVAFRNLAEPETEAS